MQVHRPVQGQVAVGVEPTDQLLAVVVEVGLHLEAVPVAEDRPGVHQLTGEPVVEHLGTAVGDLGHRPGYRQTGERPIAGLRVVVVAAPEARIQGKGGAPHSTPRHLLGAGSQRRGDRGNGAQALGEHDAPLQNLHPAHGSADDCKPGVDTEMVGDGCLAADDVAGGDGREPGPVGRAGLRVQR